MSIAVALANPLRRMTAKAASMISRTLVFESNRRGRPTPAADRERVFAIRRR